MNRDAMPRGPGSNAATQRERILAEMRRRQGTPEPWVDFRDFPGCRNITPRVSELRREHLIVTEQSPDTGCARYRLARGLDDVPARQLVAGARTAVRAADRGNKPTVQAALFEMQPAPLNAALTDWEAA